MPLLRLLANVALKHTMTVILKSINMGLQFHETKYGQIFFEHQLPALIKAINRLADVGEEMGALPITDVNCDKK